MSSRSIPPFTALRAIEAAVRHRSYTFAARELSVTHSAVSQSIKKLEGELGTKLFERRGTAMEPSAAAVQLAGAYAEAAKALTISLDKVARAPAPDRLVLTVPPAFGRLWLAPRLPRWSAAFPDLTIDLHTAGAGDDDSDLLISIGAPDGDGWSIERLCELTITPWASPDFAERHRLRHPADVLRVPLLTDRATPWSAWMKGAGLAATSPQPERSFDDMSMLLDAAERGEGLALAPTIFAQPYKASGRLVAPIPVEASSGQYLFASWQGRDEARGNIRDFMTWLRGELPF